MAEAGSMTTDRSLERGGAQPRPVGGHTVMAMLYSFPVSIVVSRTFSEIALAIANASNQDPLFPRHAAGSEATACLLVAVAWQGSRLQKWAARGTRNMGLFQVRIPEGQRVSSSVVMLPVTSSFVAIDRLRDSFRKTEGLAMGERLSAFVAESAGEEVSTRTGRASAEIMILAERLLSRYFPQKKAVDFRLLASGREG